MEISNYEIIEKIAEAPLVGKILKPENLLTFKAGDEPLPYGVCLWFCRTIININEDYVKFFVD